MLSTQFLNDDDDIRVDVDDLDNIIGCLGWYGLGGRFHDLRDIMFQKLTILNFDFLYYFYICFMFIYLLIMHDIKIPISHRYPLR